MNRIKIDLIVCGAQGKMGQRIVALAQADARFGQVFGVDKFDSLSAYLPRAQVVIDFTSPEATRAILSSVLKARRALVVGTTGVSPAVQKMMRTASKKIPLVFSPNMSVGMNVLFELVRQAAQRLSHYDIEVIEAHHHLKKDSPSGSGMRLAQMAAQGSGRKEKDFVYGRHGLVGARKNKEIGVLAVRAGDIVGDHTVMIAGPGERLELVHRAHSRDAFASGALTAAAWIAGRKSGLYSMRDVLNL